MYTSLPGLAQFALVSYDQVVVNDQGMFALFDGVSVELDSLSPANNSLFVALPKCGDTDSEEVTICPNCSNETYIPGRYCSTCGFLIWAKKMI